MDFTKDDCINSEELYDIIPKRFSSRKYTSTPLTEEHSTHLVDFAAKASAIFPDARLVVKEVDKSVFKMKFAQAKWMAAFLFKKDDQTARLHAGMLAELILLEAARLGVHTVWLGGLFDLSASVKASGCGDDEAVTGITPLGYVEGRSIFEKTTFSVMAGHKFKNGELVKRKRKDRTFFVHGATPLADWPEWAVTVLDALILAPSAINKQPWRVELVKTDGEVTLKLSSGKAGNTTLIPDDMGAGVVHISIALVKLGKTFEYEEPAGYTGVQGAVAAEWRVKE